MAKTAHKPPPKVKVVPKKGDTTGVNKPMGRIDNLGKFAHPMKKGRG